MKLSQFKITIPEGLIATHPAKNREDARLMVLDRKTGKIEHKHFKDILGYFNEGDVMVVNNTRVFPARLYGNKEKPERKLKSFCFANLTEKVVSGMFLLILHEKSGLVINFISAMTIYWLLK